MGSTICNRAKRYSRKSAASSKSGITIINKLSQTMPFVRPVRTSLTRSSKPVRPILAEKQFSGP